MYKLIIADDEESIREGMAKAVNWAELGFSVSALCANGLDVIKAIEKEKPDVVLSDIRMPKMDGVELMTYLNKNYPEIKIIILSGYSDFEYLNMSIKNQVTEYLLKPTDPDEFEALFKKMRDALDKENARREELQESFDRNFYEWLCALLKGHASEEDDLRFTPLSLQKQVFLDNCVAVVLSADGRSGDDEKELFLLKNRIIAICREQKSDIPCVYFLSQGDAIVGIYSLPTDLTLEIIDVVNIMPTLQALIKKSAGASVSVGVSELCTEKDMLPQVFEQAKCCAKQSVFYGDESVFQFSQLNSARPKDIAIFDTLLIQSALLSQNHDNVSQELNRVFASIEPSPVRDYLYLDQMCLSLLFHVSLWGLQYNMNMSEVLTSLGTGYTDIYLCDTVMQKKEFLKAVLYGVEMELNRLRQNAHKMGSVANMVRACVDRDFCNNSISLESVAGEVHKTPAYISRVFKNELGCNFSDYLSQKRIEKACMLLADISLKIYEIAFECGYADASSFIKVFRKNRGISPNEYRAALNGEANE